MRRFLVWLLLALPASATTFTGNLSDLLGNIPSNVAVRISIQNCSTYLVRLNNNAVLAYQQPQLLFVSGDSSVSGTVTDQTTIGCGNTSASVYYHVGVVQLDPATHKPGLEIWGNDYDISGSTFNLNTALPRGSAPAPPATADSLVPGDFSVEFENPSTGDSGKFQHKVHFSGNFARISCSTDVGTASINLEVRTEAAPNSTGTSALSVPLVCSSSTAVTTTFQSAGFTADAPIALIISSVAGANLVRVHVHIQPL